MSATAMTEQSEGSEGPEQSKGPAWPAWPAWPQIFPQDVAAVSSAVAAGNWNGVDAPAVLDFERRFAAYVGTDAALTVNNGTDALVVALRALDIGPTDEVIVPAYTFLATASAVLIAGAEPVFADLDPASYCMSPAAVAAALTERTAAVIAVHLGGHPADLDALGNVCARAGVALIEDCAHAHGAVWRGRPVGGYGHLATWSFQGSKNLTSGEGGAITTNDAALRKRVASIRNQGRVQGGEWYEHVRLGWNSRLTALHAALLTVGLERLPEQVLARERGAAYLDREMARLPGIHPLARDSRVDVHAHHLYLWRFRSAEAGMERQEFVTRLTDAGIPASTGYPIPLYDQVVFRDLGRPRPTLAETERACAETVWLPHNVLLAPPAQLARIVDVAASVLARADTGVAGVPDRSAAAVAT